MRPIAQAADLTDGDKLKVAQFISNAKIGEIEKSKPLMCGTGVSTFGIGEPPVFSGWGSNAH